MCITASKCQKIIYPHSLMWDQHAKINNVVSNLFFKHSRFIAGIQIQPKQTHKGQTNHLKFPFNNFLLF